MANHQRALYGFAAVAAITVGLALWITREEPRAPNAVAAPSGVPSPSPGGAVPAVTMMSAPVGTPDDLRPEPQLLDALSNQLGSPQGMRDVKAHYLEANRYPPGVLRVTADMRDLLQPNVIHSQPTVSTSSGKNEEEGLTAHFETGIARAIGADAIPLKLAVWKGQKTRKAEAIKVVKTSVAKLDGKGGRTEIGTFTMKEQPGPAERAHEHVATFDPAKAGLEGYNGPLIFTAVWQANGHESDASIVMVEYTDVAPAKFTGIVRDELANGSLDVSVGVDVTLAGSYNIDARIFEGDGEKPIGFAISTSQLEPGAQQVKLTFYGLLFRDAKKPGPYVVKTVTGFQKVSMASGGRGRQITQFDAPYTTKAYTLEQFTDKEYDSPAKQAALKAMDAEIARLEASAAKK